MFIDLFGRRTYAPNRGDFNWVGGREGEQSGDEHGYVTAAEQTFGTYLESWTSSDLMEPEDVPLK